MRIDLVNGTRRLVTTVGSAPAPRRILVIRPAAGNWAAIGPAVLWPVWGVALATAALYHHRARRRCGR